ncbi:MAG: phosphotransferase [Desulfatitalea sp.]|nr:phosphotransferase [Desulfatitalea sp.]NNK01172.1 phosphotransferase [Desulfatitalea sp.]
MKALILAAGLGTRLRPYTLHTPKPLFTLNRRPLLDITIERLLAAGCRQIVINTHHLHEQIDRFIAARRYAIEVQTRFEPEILGTGGAIANMADVWRDIPLLVINADILTDIDLAMVYGFHATHGHAVTMVMHDEPRFNSVWVDSKDRVAGFGAQPNDRAGMRRMAFTGIHVLDPRVIDYLPARGAADIIDAYAKMVAAGETIQAFIVSGHQWEDIGTPESYRTAAEKHISPIAFEQATGRPPVAPLHKEKLQGDGSDRNWYRFSDRRTSLVMVDHGIHPHPDKPAEVDAFVSIGRHLFDVGASVPRIHAWDPFSGLVYLDDLGGRHLQDIARTADAPVVRQWYRQVIDRWLDMALEGAKGFDTGWTHQSSHYDRNLILEKECRYFMVAFVNGYMGLPETFDDLADEFEALARCALADALNGFMHRDLQSRNIMIQGEKIYFIDLQGGRLGPLQYDLASLLIDPYAALGRQTQTKLLDYATAQIHMRTGMDENTFKQGYMYCALTRNLQILGAYGHLTRVKHKPFFEAFIPGALATLRDHIALKSNRFPKLATLAGTLTKRLSNKG